MSLVVDIGSGTRITSILANIQNGSDVRQMVRTFLSNKGNTNKIIGLHTERTQNAGQQNKTALLQLCDGDNCLIVQLPVDEGIDIPVELFNFLNLPYFTFVGIGIKNTLMNLEREFGLTCNNVVEIGPSSLDLLNKTEEKCRIVRQFVSFDIPASAIENVQVQFQEYPIIYTTGAVFEDWGYLGLSKNQIELATANAYFAFKIGNVVMAQY